MQYVGKMGGYVYNQWNSLNPATLSGAIDVIVIEQPDGSLHCSPWHVRFGLFQIIKPLQKKIVLYVNGIKTDLPMKLGEGGEAFFVFETDSKDLSQSVVTSPVVSPEKSPVASPESGASATSGKSEPELLDLNQSSPPFNDLEDRIKLNDSPAPDTDLYLSSPTKSSLILFEKAKQITQKLNIPSKIDINGDMVLDMDGYQPNSQKNIDLSDELLQKVLLKELDALLDGKTSHPLPDKENELYDEAYKLLQGVILKDKDGKLRIINQEQEEDLDLPNDLVPDTSPSPSSMNTTESISEATPTDDEKVYIKTLRLTSEQLKSMNLNYGQNKIKFQLSSGNSMIETDLYLWKSTTPIVISDIDGTITKSDALGHVLNMFGKDWTHTGVAKLFTDISQNGYNIMYLTARTAGQADSTRQYLDSINQDGVRLPKGPVILSPDRTIAALKREIILKKPEVFKMACLRDIKNLFFSKQGEDEDINDDRTPFYAGFGNRITDAISYKSVQVPSHRIFTINPEGEVHMELLELAGYRSSYLHIGELVDQFFPPLKYVTVFNNYWDEKQLNQYMDWQREHHHGDPQSPDSPRSLAIPGSPRSVSSFPDEIPMIHDEKYTDLNYWRDPLPVLNDLSDIDDDGVPVSPEKSAPGSPRLPYESPMLSYPSIVAPESPTPAPRQERPTSGSFNSPLKSFMMRGKPSTPTISIPTDSAEFKIKMPHNEGKTPEIDDDAEDAEGDVGDVDDDDEDDDEDDDDEDYTDDYDDDYTDEDDDDEDDVDEEEVDYEDDYEEEVDAEDEVDEEDIDQDASFETGLDDPKEASIAASNVAVKIVKASDALRDLQIE